MDDDSLGPGHPLRRSEDVPNQRIAVLANEIKNLREVELRYIREGIDDVNAKLTTQNGRIAKLEAQQLVDRTRDETLAEMIRERTANTRNVLALVVGLVGAIVTIIVKLL